MKRIVIFAIVILAALWGAGAFSQTVLTCNDGGFGSSYACGGCGSMTWRTPALGLRVADNLTQWPLIDSLPDSTPLIVSNQPHGTSAPSVEVCYLQQKTGMKTKGELLVAAPPVPPDPPTTTPGNGTLVITWDAVTTSVGGGPATVTGYHVRWNGAAVGEYITGNVLSYTITGPAGSYSVTVAAIDATGESDQSLPVAGTIATTPPDPPPTNPPVTTVEVLGTFTLKKGTSNVQTGLADYAACKALAESKATATPTKYFCTVSHTLTVSKP